MNLNTSEKWKTVKLGELILKVVDNRGKTPPISETGLELLEVNAITEKSRFPEYQLVKKFIDQDVYNSWFRAGHIQKGDIIIPTVGTIGNVAISLEDRGSVAQNLIALRFKKENDPLFLYYLLSAPKFKKQIFNLDIGGVQPSVKVPHLLESEIKIPESIEEQKEIASMLGSLDDKIELFRRENATLEKVALTLFQEWFVDFRFPRYEGLKMVNGLPEGWRVGKLGEVGEIICGKTPSKAESKYFGGNIPFIKIPDMHGQIFIARTEDSLTEEGANSQKNKFIPGNSICVSCIATVGLVSIATKDSQTNQQINSVIPKDEELLEYLFFFLKSKSGDLRMIGGGGSTTLNVNTGVFTKLEIILPDKKVIKLFHEALNPQFQKIKLNFSEIQTLLQLRESLLDKIFN